MSDKVTGVTCPECKTMVGGNSGIDIYKHAVSCFHLDDRGKESLLKLLEDRHDDYAERVKELLNKA